MAQTRQPAAQENKKENEKAEAKEDEADRVPGAISGVRSYALGLALAAALTGISFWVALDRHALWQPGVPIGLLVLALAQIGIHLVFFLHLTSGADNANNSLAVAFGVLVILLFGAGTLWIMSNLDRNMMPMGKMPPLTMQH